MVLWLIEWGIFNFRSTLPLTPSPPAPPPVSARLPPPLPPTHACIRRTYSRVFASTATLARPFTRTRVKTTQTSLPPSIAPYLPFSNKASYYGITPFATRHNVRFLRDITPVSFVPPPLPTLSFHLSYRLSLFLLLLFVSPLWDNVSRRDSPIYLFIHLWNILRGVLTAIIIRSARSKEIRGEYPLLLNKSRT